LKFRPKHFLILFILAFIVTAGLIYRSKLTKSQPVFKEHVVSRSDLEIAVQATGTIQPENRLIVKPQISGRIDEILVQEGQRVKAGQILARMSSNDRAALLDMARSSSDSEVKRWEDIYKPSPVIAPLGGIIIGKQVERGQTVGTSDTIFVISDRLIVLAQVDETDLGRIALGQRVEIRVDAYSDHLVTGEVIRIAFESKQVNNVTIYEIRILPHEVPKFFRSGMTASVKFIQDRKVNVILAPVSFLRAKGEKNTSQSQIKSGDVALALIKSKSPDTPPTQAEVTLGATNGQFFEITSGLVEGVVILQEQQTASEDDSSSNPFSPMRGPRNKKGK
jgi:macrolide-specific efflux system membrane fusion protein